jgi:hypothetical protein
MKNIAMLLLPADNFSRSSFFCSLYASRISLFILLRSTAFLKFLLLTVNAACSVSCDGVNKYSALTG